MKQPLVAMSYPCATAIRLVSNLAAKIAVHTGLLLLYPTNTAANHWRVELSAYLTKVQGYLNIKTGTGLLDRDVVVTKLCDEPLGSDRQVLILQKQCVHHMKNLPISKALSRERLVEIYDRFITICYDTEVITVSVLENAMGDRS